MFLKTQGDFWDSARTAIKIFNMVWLYYHSRKTSKERWAYSPLSYVVLNQWRTILKGSNKCTSGCHSWHWRDSTATSCWFPLSPSLWDLLTQRQTPSASSPFWTSSEALLAWMGPLWRSLWGEAIFCVQGGHPLQCHHLPGRHWKGNVSVMSHVTVY